VCDVGTSTGLLRQVKEKENINYVGIISGVVN
jgi:hypothetical protein